MVPEIWSATDRIFCHLDPFLLFYPPNNLKNQNFEKMKKTSGDITVLHMSAINDNHMIYGSSDMKRDGRNFFVILDYFLHFYPSKNPEKSKLRKNEKITWSYYHFTQAHQKS